MRLAFFSPLPPAKSGIADYSAALLDSLTRHAAIDVYTQNEPNFDPAGLDGVIYQLGNNPFHSFVYEQALQAPGIVVMHEANLHHLIADITIRRGDWDAYMREVEYDGGAAALAFAHRVRRLEVGPDYEGVSMLRRVLESSRGAIAHSRFVAGKLRDTGFKGPIAVIPHGAWLTDADRAGARAKLGIGESTPLIGMFGFLKPYKRIPECLRAFRRLLAVFPDARLLLGGEVHPDLPLQSMISSLGIGASVRVTGFADMPEFVGSIAAADIVLNLRYPTVGETSGTLLRALGLGKAVLVSDVGAFAEYPDHVCLKVPVDNSEEDAIFEYLRLLLSRPDLRESLGHTAREWVTRECSWEIVAGKYADFVKAVRDGTAPVEASRQEPMEVSFGVKAEAPPADPPVESCSLATYIRGWAKEEWARAYVEDHITRLVHTLEITPRGGPGKRALEMGAYLQVTAALKTQLGYEEVRGCYYGPAGTSEMRSAVSSTGEMFSCPVDFFDAECDPFPYADGWFDTVLCCELIEHLPTDPMHLMWEINRILKSGGHLVLTTPNAASLRAIAAILQGYHPGFFPAYIKPKRPGEEVDPRHAREYAPREISHLLEDSGFEVARLETGEFREAPRPERLWVEALLEQHGFAGDLRQEDIYAVGRKTGSPRERYPDWLYVG
jgi:glycosyltransferase involved in cell wall biosynthesis/SAM-dependent methyltransferase